MQYVNYIQAHYPEHEFKVLHISRRIRKLEKNEQAFSAIIDDIDSSDAVLWAFPLYVQLVPSQYKRFVELIWERGVQSAFKDKYTAVLSTSIHFYDHTAHCYMQSICDDLEMKFASAFSADMHDLMKPEGQMQARQFGQNLIDIISLNISCTRRFMPVVQNDFEYTPGEVDGKTDSKGKKIIILHDAKENQTNLQGMINRLKNSFSQTVEVYNLHDVLIKAGCLGCLKCGQNYECTYTGKDEFIEFYNNKVKTADILIYAGQIVDRYLSSRWKLFFDRGFFNCHTPSLTGKQFAFLISGPLSHCWNIREILDGYVQWQGSNIVDFVTDEISDSGQLDAQITDLAHRLVWNSEQKYIKPHTFLGVGGHKIFRDDIFSNLRFVFQADHRYFKNNGLYDFPQKKVGLRALNIFLGMIFRVPKIRKEFDKMVKKKMIEPHQKVVRAVTE